MPTTQEYNELWKAHEDLKREVVLYLSRPIHLREEDALWELASDYEPTESEQGLIPIPKGYAEP